MFTSSVRRVARSNPLSCTITARPTTPSITATVPCLERRTHHRKHSSSKPPVPPNDGSRNIDATAQAPGKEVAPGTKEEPEKRTEGRMGKRRTKDSTDTTSLKVKDDAKVHLPSVPSTQHLTPNDIKVASLFSLHRPLSVTSAVPAVTTSEAFSSIFAPRKSSKPLPNDIIYTLASTLNGLESAVQQQQQQQQQQQPQSQSSEEADLRKSVTQASVSNAENGQTHLDGAPAWSDLKLSVQELTKRFTPFNPPPAPVPMGSEEADILEPTSAGSVDAQGQQRYSAVLTIREATNAHGLKSYSAHTSPLVRIQDESSNGPDIYAPASTPLRRMNHLRRHPDKMQALSVKRQRKLKMKKHKYKKLMRRTRNLRRRLDRN